MSTRSYPRVKSGRGVTLTPHPFSCRGQERVELYLYSPYGPYDLYRVSVPIQGCTLPFTFLENPASFRLFHSSTHFPSHNGPVTQLFLLSLQNSTFLVISSCDLKQGTSPTNFTLPHMHSVGAINVSMTISSSPVC